MEYLNVSPAQLPSYKHFPEVHSWAKSPSIEDFQGVVLLRRIEWTLLPVCLQYILFSTHNSRVRTTLYQPSQLLGPSFYGLYCVDDDW